MAVPERLTGNGGRASMSAVPSPGAALIAACLVATGCASSPAAPKPDIILLVIDCLRADHLGTYGYSRPTSPNLDQFVADAVVFEQAIAQSNWTRPSIASLFTSLYPSQHQVPGINTPEERRAALRLAREDLNVDRILDGNALSAEFVTLAEALGGAGYATAAFINQAQMPPYLGFAQGFDVYEITPVATYLETNSDRGVTDGYQEWTVDSPGFAYLHFLNLHFPYDPGERTDIFRTSRALPPNGMSSAERRRFWRELRPTAEHSEELAALYDAEILASDRMFGRLVRFLVETGRYEDTLLIVTSDHGEAFNEHGTFKHGGSNLYSELVRVPLLIKLPGRRFAGTRVDTPVELLDVMPTLLDAASVPAPDDLAGRSLLPLIRGDEGARPVFAESTNEQRRQAVYLDGLKYILDLDSDSIEAYDYASDPGETRDLTEELDASSLRDARALLERWQSANVTFSQRYTQTAIPMAEEEIERLRALGYVR